jgi:hypothetical protein
MLTVGVVAITLLSSGPALARTLEEVQWDLDTAYFELYSAIEQEGAAWMKLNQIGANCGGYNSYDCWGWEYDLAMAELSAAQVRVAAADGTINALWAEYNRILNGGE